MQCTQCMQCPRVNYLACVDLICDSMHDIKHHVGFEMLAASHLTLHVVCWVGCFCARQVWSAGMVMGLIDDIPTCEALVHGMVAEAEAIISGRLAGMLVK